MGRCVAGHWSPSSRLSVTTPPPQHQYTIDQNVGLEAELGEENTLCSEDRLTTKYFSFTVNKAQVLSNLVGLVVPVIVSIYYKWLGKQWYILDLLRRQITTVHLDHISARLIFTVVSVGEVLQITVYNYLVRRLLVSDDPEPVPEKTVECEVLHDPGPQERRADIIFVHGIKGHLEKTWTQGMWYNTTLRVLNLKDENAKEKVWEMNGGSMEMNKSTCWPRDWLPQDCPNARVIAINYTTDPYLWRPVWIRQNTRSSLPERSWEMIESLVEKGVGKHSIFWVGHSKGGLYVKQMLVNACEALESKYQDLRRNTKGIMFYSVPHRGSPLANLNFPLLRPSIELLEVKKNCKEVLTLHKNFLYLLNTKQLDIDVKSVTETRLTLMAFVYLRIVPEESADAEVGELYGVPLDHRNICKPKNRECFLYRELVKLIQANSENM